MLNLIYGWCGSSVDNSSSENLLTQFSDENFNISSKLKISSIGGVASFSTSKAFYNIETEHYIFSAIGHIYWNSNDKITNPEKLLEKYHTQGISFLSKLKGHYLLIIFDKEKKSCFIANDQMATIPLYYAKSNNGNLVFSNRLNLLSATPDIQCVLDPQAIYNYIYNHMIPSPGTIYKSIKKLEPGQLLFFDNDEIILKDYLATEFMEESEKTESQLAHEIFKTLDDSVKAYCHTPKSLGCFLSGGLDSSAVAGMLAKNTNNNANTFSIGFPVVEYNEIEYARTASKTFNTNQHEYFIQPEDVDSIINDIVSSMDEPFGNSSVIPVYYCAKLAKENGINHLLAGDGGDEIFAGNTRYAKQQIFEQYRLVPKILRQKFLEPIINSSLFKTNFIGRKAKSFIDQANIPLPARLETYNFLHLNTPESVFSDEFLSQVNPDKPIDLLNKTYNRPKDASYLNRMLFLDWKNTLADNDLRKVTMMCELAGVDVSYPMLSNDMIDLSCQIPSKLKLTPHKLRYLYKKSMNGFLPKSIINKPKHGFGLPFGVWTKTDKKLQKIAYEAIDNLKKYNIFNEDFLDDTIHKHQNEHASFYGELIWILMVLGIWIDKHHKNLDNR